MGFNPTLLRQVTPPASQNHFNRWWIPARDLHGDGSDGNRAGILRESHGLETCCVSKSNAEMKS